MERWVLVSEMNSYGAKENEGTDEYPAPADGVCRVYLAEPESKDVREGP